MLSVEIPCLLVLSLLPRSGSVSCKRLHMLTACASPSWFQWLTLTDGTKSKKTRFRIFWEPFLNLPDGSMRISHSRMVLPNSEWCLYATPQHWHSCPWGCAKALLVYLEIFKHSNLVIFNFNWTSKRWTSGILEDFEFHQFCICWTVAPVHVRPVVGSQKGSWTTEL